MSDNDRSSQGQTPLQGLGPDADGQTAVDAASGEPDRVPTIDSIGDAIDLGLAYDADLTAAKSVTGDAIESFDWLREGEPCSVYMLGFGESSISCSARYWIDYPGDVGYFEAIHRGVVAIQAACAYAGITIPYPIRTLDVPAGSSLARRITDEPNEDGDPPGDGHEHN
ncbi:MAG: hypothetical protein PF961_07190 [Planctomycetota bacterium]|jgi:small-conductance mechanosensitive channel|nr:hypothetical protein [Planctomycetota bacterium]